MCRLSQEHRLATNQASSCEPVGPSCQTPTMNSPNLGQLVLVLAILSVASVGVGAAVGIIWTRTAAREKLQTVTARHEVDLTRWQAERAEVDSEIANYQGQLSSERQAHSLVRSDLQRERTTKTELQQKMQPLELATLLAVLRTISYAWQQDKVASQAKEIHTQGIELHKRLVTMATHFQVLGGSLAKSVDSFNRTVSSMETRVLPSARRFEKLTDISNVLPDPDRVERDTKPIAPHKWASALDTVSPTDDPPDGIDPQSHTTDTETLLDGRDTRRSA